MRARTGLLAVMAVVVAACSGGAVPSGSPSEGIAVHGDWTIEVYDADGTLVDTTTFSNGLVEVGRSALVAIMGGERVIDRESWAITFRGGCGVDLADRCRIDDVTVETVDTGVQGVSDDAIVLSGSTVATDEGTVGLVETRLSTCTSAQSADSCPGNASQFPGSSSPEIIFTLKTLDVADQVAVSAGQIIQVEVVISFG